LWGFGPDKQRTYEVSTKATTTGGSTFNALNITWFAGPGHFELDETIDTASGSWRITEMRHFITSPEGNIGVVAITASTDAAHPADIRTERYFLKDHLGSNAGTFKQNALESRATYDVWGVRVESGNPALAGFDTSQRGYTGHEHLATFGLIHMNGRIYDPLLGRFLQADPIIDEPFNLQSYNRYSYVANNPLAFTDPTGYSKWNRIRDRVIKPIAIMVVAYYTGQFVGNWITASGTVTSSSATVSTVVEGVGAVTNTATATSVSSGTISLAGAGSGAAAGFAAGGLQGGNLNSALQGAVTGGISGGINGFFGNSYNLTRVGVETVAGGINARINGGSFSSGTKRGAIYSLLTYGNWAMRQDTIAHSRLNTTGANSNGISDGFMSDGFSAAGARAEYDSNGDKLPCIAPLGGCQGRADTSNGDQTKNIFGIPYSPNGLPDHVNESFAGPHDWFRKLTGAYDAMGNSRHVTGFALKWDSFMNFANLVPAAPFALAGFIHTKVPALEHVFGKSK
jgi:RHS repeat-associated protein